MLSFVVEIGGCSAPGLCQMPLPDVFVRLQNAAAGTPGQVGWSRDLSVPAISAHFMKT